MSKVGQLSKVSKHFLNESVVITSDIWDRDKDYPKQFLPHVGYDYRAKIGTPVYAPFAGEIVQVTPNLGSSYGRQVYVFNGMHTFHTAHYSKVDVKQGQRVKKGALLGLSGASGASENTYAPHLHAGLAKGRITNAGNKGSFLGDAWVDLEEMNFDKPLLSNEEVAQEVLQGKWDNGTKRINALKGAGYNPSEVQQLVNQLSKSNLNKPSKTNVGKIAQLRGKVTLYDKSGKPYPTPSGRNRDRKILEEHNGMFLISDAAFSPSKVWVKALSVKVV